MQFYAEWQWSKKDFYILWVEIQNKSHAKTFLKWFLNAFPAPGAKRGGGQFTKMYQGNTIVNKVVIELMVNIVKHNKLYNSLFFDSGG